MKKLSSLKNLVIGFIAFIASITFTQKVSAHSSRPDNVQTYDRCFKGSNATRGIAQLAGWMSPVQSDWSLKMRMQYDEIGRQLASYRLCYSDGTPIVWTDQNIRDFIRKGHANYPETGVWVNGRYVWQQGYMDYSEEIPMNGRIGIWCRTWEYHLVGKNTVVHELNDYGIVKIDAGLGDVGKPCMNPGRIIIASDRPISTDVKPEQMIIDDTVYVLRVDTVTNYIESTQYVEGEPVQYATVGYVSFSMGTCFPHYYEQPICHSAPNVNININVNNSTSTTIIHNPAPIVYCGGNPHPPVVHNPGSGEEPYNDTDGVGNENGGSESGNGLVGNNGDLASGNNSGDSYTGGKDNVPQGVKGGGRENTFSANNPKNNVSYNSDPRPTHQESNNALTATPGTVRPVTSNGDVKGNDYQNYQPDPRPIHYSSSNGDIKQPVKNNLNNYTAMNADGNSYVPDPRPVRPAKNNGNNFDVKPTTPVKNNNVVPSRQLKYYADQSNNNVVPKDVNNKYQVKDQRPSGPQIHQVPQQKPQQSQLQPRRVQRPYSK